ncbi:MAG: hypothetical protein A3C06_02750 [Candidatus Taylorbacteria bacterium RIFCSPHIGHO2_02_FULL_46_13]|uniref:dTDP-4-dehydrorhamnose reductase n=1 Tax=Candidatus Taylorbacteria bacterium RIFCSPHIGHO2_02_FULL_46_13 TaxID=1802312 RepID=A0A1G2MU30_9BACT|nr:MAG: hypothetical protein A3C06_02750 [Candidatus Taylorbacteria bacterium RIFCSPHIGHO2_02_FULL_46_13]
MSLDLSNVLITGGEGMVARYADFGTKLSHRELDITNKEQVFSVITAYKPSAVIHLAALTNMRTCEESPAEAHRVNAEGTENVAGACKEIDAVMVYLSTNAVFDGKKDTAYNETDMPNPQNEYGKSKLVGEQAVICAKGPFLIVRSGWIFGGGVAHNKRFVGNIVKQLGEKEIKVVSDNQGTPTYAKDLMDSIKRLLVQGEREIVHIANSESASRFEQATHIAKTLGYKGQLIPLRVSELQVVPAPLANEALTSNKIHLRPWQEALSEYLAAEFHHAG